MNETVHRSAAVSRRGPVDLGLPGRPSCILCVIFGALAGGQKSVRVLPQPLQHSGRETDGVLRAVHLQAEALDSVRRRKNDFGLFYDQLDGLHSANVVVLRALHGACVGSNEVDGAGGRQSGRCGV
jgi:hypothetical protein